MDPKEAVEVLKRFRDTGQLSTILCDAIDAVLAELEHPSWGRSRAIEQAIKCADAAEAEVKALVGALEKYGKHKAWCKYIGTPENPGTCTCGFRRARAEAGGGERHE